MATSTNKPITEMTKLELIEKVKGQRFVLAKLNKEMHDKDEEIAHLTKLLDKAQKQKG